MNVEFSHAFRSTNDVDPAWTDLDLVRRARSLDRMGLDGVLVDTGEGSLANIALAERLLRSSAVGSIVVAHWVGEMEPLQAARDFARLADGTDRVSISLRANRGAGTSYAARISQLDEYATLLKRLWLSDRPFEHQGSYFALSCDNCGTRAQVSLRVGGRSGLVQNVAAQAAETFELPAADNAETVATIARITAFATERGRAAHLGFAMPVALDEVGAGQGIALPGEPLKDTLVLLDYFDAGVGEFVLHGSDEAVQAFAREVMPLVRNSVSRRFDRGSDAVAPEMWSQNLHRT